MNPKHPDAATITREATYICRPDGFTCYRAISVAAADLLTSFDSGFVRPTWRAVLVRPPVCPVNGDEGEGCAYYVRMPHRPDGVRLRCVD